MRAGREEDYEWRPESQHSGGEATGNMPERQRKNDRGEGKAKSMKVEEDQLLKTEVPPLGWPHARNFQEHLLYGCVIEIPLERFEEGMRAEGARAVSAGRWLERFGHEGQ